MDGFHDLGGRQGFGQITVDGKKEPFHADWEVKINAISGKLVARHIYNMDEYRYAIERMDPRNYVGASYYERTLTAVATLCIEKGLITHDELNAAVGEYVPISHEKKAGRVTPNNLPELNIGDKVVVKSDFVPGHIRMPSYIRGKQGVVVGISPEYPFPDAAAHGLTSHKQRTFDVRFRSADLWSDGADDAEVHVGVFHAYLEKLD
jgi:nitrile hydratase beta subunit